jgi:hypothetical protein
MQGIKGKKEGRQMDRRGDGRKDGRKKDGTGGSERRMKRWMDERTEDEWKNRKGEAKKELNEMVDDFFCGGGFLS